MRAPVLFHLIKDALISLELKVMNDPLVTQQFAVLILKGDVAK